MKKECKVNKKIVLKLFLFLTILWMGSWVPVDAADKINIQDAVIENFYDYPFTGAPVMPENMIVLKYGDTTLIKGTDYSITRSGSLYGTKESTTSVLITIKGKGNYEGTIEKEYQIIPNTEYTLRMSRPYLDMTIMGGVRTLSIYTTPSVYIDPNKVTWTSSNPNVVTVDNSGNLTPVSLGTATITAHFNGQEVTSQVAILEYIRGDVNMDGQINLKDIMELMNFYTKKKVPTEENIKFGDMNNDGELNMKDSTPILAIFLKK